MEEVDRSPFFAASAVLFTRTGMFRTNAHAPEPTDEDVGGLDHFDMGLWLQHYPQVSGRGHNRESSARRQSGRAGGVSDVAFK